MSVIFKITDKRFIIIAFAFLPLFALHSQTKALPYLKVSPNGHYLMTEKGDPFFWLADTGWLLMQKLNHQDVAKYLDDRKAKGFNVVQMMVLHDASDCNYYKDSALVNGNLVAPYMTNGKAFADYIQYDYWDNVEWVVDEAAKRGMYAAIVPVWGSVVKKKQVTIGMIRVYMNLLCQKLQDRTNVIWMAGGDIHGNEYAQIWNEMGEAVKLHNRKQLVTFHPYGRTQSSTWFHQAPWLDFNMVQSGHRSYEQDSTGYGEDNWKYIASDYERTPVKPVLDGEPSYEGIPHGLHDTLQPRWTDNDVRRYAYWSVFAGGCGFTYGNNSVMQFYLPGAKDRAYGVTEPWTSAIDAKGANQMQFLKKLILSKPYFERVPDQTMVLDSGVKYDYVAATRGKDYAFFYTCNGRDFKVNAGVLHANKLKATWYNPRNGQTLPIGVMDNKGMLDFNPLGEKQEGNDWVLILEGN